MSWGFTSLDMMVLLSIAVAGGFGAVRGFVTEVFLLAAWVAGFVMVKLFSGVAADMLAPRVGSAGGASILSVVLLFGVTALIVRLVGKRMGNAMLGSLLGPFDRVLGLGFGMIKGLFAATLAFLLMSLVYDVLNGAHSERPEWMTASRTYDLLRASSRALVDAVEAGRAR